MTALPKFNIIVIEPNTKLLFPYHFLYTQDIIRFSSIKPAMDAYLKNVPNLIFCSASFSPEQHLQFLEFLKNTTNHDFIPLILVVDLTNRINFIPGITWGNNIGVIDTRISKYELDLTIKRVLLGERNLLY